MFTYKLFIYQRPIDLAHQLYYFFVITVPYGISWNTTNNGVRWHIPCNYRSCGYDGTLSYRHTVEYGGTITNPYIILNCNIPFATSFRLLIAKQLNLKWIGRQCIGWVFTVNHKGHIRSN